MVSTRLKIYLTLFLILPAITQTGFTEEQNDWETILSISDRRLYLNFYGITTDDYMGDDEDTSDSVWQITDNPYFKDALWLNIAVIYKGYKLEFSLNDIINGFDNFNLYSSHFADHWGFDLRYFYNSGNFALLRDDKEGNVPILIDGENYFKDLKVLDTGVSLYWAPFNNPLEEIFRGFAKKSEFEFSFSPYLRTGLGFLKLNNESPIPYWDEDSSLDYNISKARMFNNSYGLGLSGMAYFRNFYATGLFEVYDSVVLASTNEYKNQFENALDFTGSLILGYSTKKLRIGYYVLTTSSTGVLTLNSAGDIKSMITSRLFNGGIFLTFFPEMFNTD